MHKIRWWLSALLLLPFCVSAQVQTLKEAAEQAVLSNPEVLQRLHALEAAKGERGVAVGAMLPRLDLTAGTGNDSRNDPLVRQNLNRNSSALTLTQLLYDGFASYNDIRRLDHASQVRLFELYDSFESVTLEVARAYFDVLRYRTLVHLAEENYVRHRSVFEQIQKKAMAGVGRKVDLEQASGRLALSESNLLVETSNLHDVGARFLRLVGSPPRAEMEAPAALNNIPADLTGALKTATHLHPSLRAAIENVRSGQSSLRTRYGAFQPRFDLRLRSEEGQNLNSVVGKSHNNTAEVVMSWNLFNGGSDLARVRQYAEQLNVAKDLRDKTCRDLRQTLTIAYNDTRKLVEQLTYLDQHQVAIEKARDAYRKQFDIGQRTLLDVLDTENELFQAKRAYTNADYDLQISYIRAHAGIGSLFTTLGLSRPDTEPLPASGPDDLADICPAEGAPLYIVDKAALNARAQQLVKESVPQADADTQVVRAVSPPVTQVILGPEKAIGEALKAWVNAWTARMYQAYIDAYSATFKPAKGVTREAWLAQRKAALENAKEITLDITDIKLVMVDATHATTTFRQNYRSKSYQDIVQKTLAWENVGGRWFIVRETVDAKN